MNCYLHPDVPGVSTCGNCGVALCSECESKSFYRLNNGKGQALCKRCSLTACEENIAYLKKWLTKRLIKLICAGFLIVIGIIHFISCKVTSSPIDWGGLIITLWILLGAVINIGAKKPETPNSNTKIIVADPNLFVGIYGTKIFFKILGTVFSILIAPITFITSLIEYLVTRSNYKDELANHETLLAAQ